jgi:DNA invertase Pin-like site-specific DNA recombinase
VECKLCGREYVALGVHLRHKHAVDPDDYREEFGILRITPLVDLELSMHLSAAAKRRLLDSTYREETVARCRANIEANKGKPSSGMTKAGKEKLADRNRKVNVTYLRDLAPKVIRVLGKKKTVSDVCAALGTSPLVVKKILAAAGVSNAREKANQERLKRLRATNRAKTLKRIEKMLAYLEVSKSAAEMCRLSGVSIKTYKSWVNRGVIERYSILRNKVVRTWATAGLTD